MGLVVGIDEAGRGPVLGPLVMAGVLVDEKNLRKLRDIGVTDSKLLSKEKREQLFTMIKEIIVDYKIIEVHPAEIDNKNALGTNLNQIEGTKSCEILKYFGKYSKATIDCPSINPLGYEDYLRGMVGKDVNLVVEHKADENYVEVGAASILAKVTRDFEMQKIKEDIGIECGSGYPSDPVTQEFLKNYWDKHDSIMRKCWSSYKEVKRKKEQKGLMDF